MKTIIIVLAICVASSCTKKKEDEKVLYEELTPKEFSERLAKAPIAYLPLGTLEWHGEHLPLGSDGLQSFEFFKLLAKEVGGIVLPKLFLGPDRPGNYDTITTIDGKEYYGMDLGIDADMIIGHGHGRRNVRYKTRQLTGSAYYLPDNTFHLMMHGIMKQLSRAGFKIVVAHGHGPSNRYVLSHIKEFKDMYNLTVISCSSFDVGYLCFICDHAAANETSLMMALRPELVQMENLPKDTSEILIGVGGIDPRIHASKAFGKEIIDFQFTRVVSVLKAELDKLK